MIDKSNKKFWDRFAKLYAPFMKKDKGVYDKVCEYIRPHLNKDMDVLEIIIPKWIQDVGKIKMFAFAV
ncbi:class I SAM-dependent methyltransferase [Peptoniphilus sp. GNH]|nr:class I SAM-dependent methyltransferase [Peptoniphilus sp. GNH]